jgi:hypothetical protein
VLARIITGADVSVRKTLAMLVQRTLMVFSATFAAEVLADLSLPTSPRPIPS